MQKTITSTLLSLFLLLLMATAAKAQESGESDSDARFEIRTLPVHNLRGPLKAWVTDCYDNHTLLDGDRVRMVSIGGTTYITLENNSVIRTLRHCGNSKILIVRPPYPDFF